MTEQEAKELIKYINEEYFYYDKEGEFDEINEALDMAISALEEIQQYRALGTVEELREASSSRQKEIDHWIPCSEQLPEKRDNYLCTIENTAGNRFRMIGHYNMPNWTDDNKIQHTIAWQPLPELYKGC